MEIHSCATCDTKFHSERRLVSHERIYQNHRRKHLGNDDNGVTCGGCGRVFLRKSDLAKHERRNVGKRYGKALSDERLSTSICDTLALSHSQVTPVTLDPDEQAPDSKPYFPDLHETARQEDQGQKTVTLVAPIAFEPHEKLLLTHTESWSGQREGTAYTNCGYPIDIEYAFLDDTAFNGSGAPTSPCHLDSEEQTPNSDSDFLDSNESACRPRQAQSKVNLVAPVASEPYVHRRVSNLNIWDRDLHLNQPMDPPLSPDPRVYSFNRDLQDENLTQTQVSGTPADECDANNGGSGTLANSVLSTSDDIVIDGIESPAPSSVAPGYPENNAGDSPPASRSLAAMFKEAQTGLERLFMDLRSFEDDVRDDISVTGSDFSDIFEAEDPCDGHGREAGNRQTSGGISRVTGAGDQEPHRSGRKRQRSETCNDDDSRTIVDTTQQEPISGSAQTRLKCCHKNCSGTDDHICEVIKSLSTHKDHKIHICKECFVRLPDDSPDNVHRSLDCVKHCLSTKCNGNPTPALDQRHRSVPGVCLSRSMKRGDIEDNYRYIFRLVHPNPETHPQPDNVFTTEKDNHTGVNSRRRTRGLNKQELLARSDALTAQANTSAALVEELRETVAANTTQTRVLISELAAERTTTTYLWKMVKRLQTIADEALQSETVGNQNSLFNLRRRAETERSDALEFARALSQALPTPPVSVRASHRSSALSTPNDSGTAGQYQPSRNASQQHHNNYAVSEAAHYTSDQGNRAANPYPDEQALLHTQNNSAGFPDNLGNAYGTTANLELATNWNAGTDDDVPRSDSNQHNNLLQFNPKHFNPHQSNLSLDPNLLNLHQLSPNYINPNLLNAHRPTLHQPTPHQPTPHQPTPHQPNPHRPTLHRPDPLQINQGQWAGETEGDSFEFIGPQEPFPSATFADWLPESIPEIESFIFQGMGYEDTQWYPLPSG